MSIAAVLLLLHFSFSTVPTAHTKPLPYLSPTTIFPNYQNMLNSFKIFIYTNPTNPPLNFTTAAESLFYATLLRGPFAAATAADDAHLFFVPFSGDLPARSVARLVCTLRNDLPHWNRTLGADHFFLSSAGIGYESEQNLVELKKNFVQISCFPTPVGKLIPHMDISLPPLSSSSLRRDDAPSPNKTTSVLGYVGYNWVNKESKLVNELSSDPDLVIESRPLDENLYAERLGGNKFCLFEYGGGGEVSEIGLALRFGCMPMVITDRPIVDLSFSDVLRWQEIAVFVKSGGGGGGGGAEPKRVLDRTCGEGRHERMRGLGVVASRHFVWNETPEPLDAFHTLMYQLWLRRHTIRYMQREYGIVGFLRLVYSGLLLSQGQFSIVVLS